MSLPLCRRIEHVDNTEVVAPHSTSGGGGSVIGGTVSAGANPRISPRERNRRDLDRWPGGGRERHSTHTTVTWACKGHVRANLPMVGAKRETLQPKTQRQGTGDRLKKK